jgi:hypothetical protein
LIDQHIDTVTVGRVVGTADVGFYKWLASVEPSRTGIGYIVGRVMFRPTAPPARRRRLSGCVSDQCCRRRAVLAAVGVGILLAAHAMVVGVFGARVSPRPCVANLACVRCFRAFAARTRAVIQAAGRDLVIVFLNVGSSSPLRGAFTLTPA